MSYSADFEVPEQFDWVEKYEKVLRVHLRDLPAEAEIPPWGRLSELGVDSLSTVQLLLDIEDAFRVSFPDELMTVKTFETVASLRAVIWDLLTEAGQIEGGSNGNA